MCAHLSSHRKGMFPISADNGETYKRTARWKPILRGIKNIQHSTRLLVTWCQMCFLRNCDNKKSCHLCTETEAGKSTNSAPNNSPWQRFNANILGEYVKKNNTFLTSHLASSGCRMQYIWSCSLVIVFVGLSLVHTGARKCLPLKLQKESNRFQWPWRENKKRMQIFRNHPLKSSTQHRLPHLHLQRRLKHKRPQEYH